MHLIERTFKIIAINLIQLIQFGIDKIAIHLMISNIRYSIFNYHHLNVLAKILVFSFPYCVSSISYLNLYFTLDMLLMPSINTRLTQLRVPNVLCHFFP